MPFNTNIGRQSFTASESQTDFDFNFKIYAEEDIKVYSTPVKQQPDDASDLLSYGSDYTVTIDGDDGGTITLITAAVLDDTLVIVRDLPRTRPISYVTNGDLKADTLNKDQDYQTYLLIDGFYTRDRALILPDTDVIMSNILPTTRSNTFIKVKDDGTGFEYADTAFSLDGDAAYVETIALLKLIDVVTTTKANVLGYDINGDGGGGSFYWDPASIESDNGGTIIQSDGITIGRWKRIYTGGVSVKWFGAVGDGTTDDTDSIQATIDMGGVIYIPDGTYKITTQINLISNIEIIGTKNTVIKGSGSFTTNSLIYATNKTNCTLKNLSFLSDSYTSEESVIKFDLDATTIVEDILLEGLSFNGFESKSCIAFSNTIDDADWTHFDEPAEPWNTFLNTVVKDIVIKNCTLPDTLYGTGAIRFTGCSKTTISNITIRDYNQRGISVGYCKDVNINDCYITTLDNGNANTNSHGIYLRTTKRFSISDVYINISGVAGGVRLSRGAYYGEINNVTVISTSSSGNCLMYLGANNTVTSNCVLKGIGRMMMIGPHASASGSDGYADASFAEGNNLIFSNITAESSDATKQMIYYYALGVPATEPSQPFLYNNIISNSVFVHTGTDVTTCEIETGNVDFKGCRFTATEPDKFIHINREVRVTVGHVIVNVSDCDFSTSSTTDGGLNGLFGRSAILFEGEGVNDNHITNCKFRNIYTSIGIGNGADVYITDNIFDETIALMTSGSLSTDVYFKGNFCTRTTAGQCIYIKVTNSTASKYSFISNNIFNLLGAQAVRMSVTDFEKLLFTHNAIDTTSYALRDISNVVGNVVAHNTVVETTATVLGGNITDTNNAWL